ncbi:hypothetical protein IL306_007781 [Fusarium sp. DS 682]|nr:hypothetical protein IL306_007781 [Fusarium sp. DS 682]
MPSNTFFAGDFNAHYRTWQPGVVTRHRGNTLAAWITDQDLEIYNAPGEPTHEVGNVLDLTFGPKSSAGSRMPPDSNPDTKAADNLASLLTNALRDSLKVAGRKRRPNGKAKRWWNKDCKLKCRAWHAAYVVDRTGHYTLELKTQFKQTVRRAKAKY